MESREIELSGGTFAYLEAGEGGLPILLVHGFTGSKEDFGEELDALAAKGFHAIAPELRGHGDSPKFGDESAYSLEIFVADLVEFLDELRWERFTLLGHSMGGMIAQVLTVADPERVERLILMDTHHGPLTGLDPELLAIGLDIVRTQGLATLQEILKMGADPLVNVAYERLCGERPGYREWSESKLLRCDPAMYAAGLQLMPAQRDRLDDVRSLPMPTLVMVGEFDAGFVDAAHRLADAIPNARLDVLAGGGHCPQFEASDAWRASLYSFLDESS